MKILGRQMIITLMTPEPIFIDGVQITQGEQLSVHTLTEDMIKAHAEGKLRITSEEETLEERKQDVAAIEDGVAAMDRIIK